MVVSAHERNSQLASLHYVAHIEMAASYVLAPAVVFGVIGEIPRPLIIRGARRWTIRRDAQACQ